ncbi:MAG: FtsB family cell division protein [Myxococcota bacterium]
MVCAGLFVSVLLAVLSASGERGLRRVHRFVGEVARIEELNETLRAENARLAKEIEALRNDPAAAEAVARDDLGLIRPGEKVYRFEGGGE